ncbi:putative oxidoreductase C19A8.06 [Mycena venus]|uniref:Putative oxidoreductase C19A8.06 n=1 Tax=Mycena venus TaxID=2733690 RepID=A0A8H6YKM0_9AGAR|nr:putative oxidoreductase C19A8.06 [Mycena venus]
MHSLPSPIHPSAIHQRPPSPSHLNSHVHTPLSNANALLSSRRYILLLPLWFLFSKSAAVSVQSVLMSCFCRRRVSYFPVISYSSFVFPSRPPFHFAILSRPAPLRFVYLHADSHPSQISKSSSAEKPDPLAEPEEALKPGALYTECAVVRVDVPPPGSDSDSAPSTSGEGAPHAGKGKAKDGAGDEAGIVPEDDGELGGERAGRAVWEAYEQGLKAWEGRWDAEAYAQASERTYPRSHPVVATRDVSVAG